MGNKTNRSSEPNRINVEGGDAELRDGGQHVGREVDGWCATFGFHGRLGVNATFPTRGKKGT